MSEAEAQGWAQCASVAAQLLSPEVSLVCSYLTQVSAGNAGFCAAQYGDDISAVLLIALFFAGFQALLCRSKEL